MRKSMQSHDVHACTILPLHAMSYVLSFFLCSLSSGFCSLSSALCCPPPPSPSQPLLWHFNAPLHISLHAFAFMYRLLWTRLSIMSPRASASSPRGVAQKMSKRIANEGGGQIDPIVDLPMKIIVHWEHTHWHGVRHLFMLRTSIRTLTPPV